MTCRRTLSFRAFFPILLTLLSGALAMGQQPSNQNQKYLVLRHFVVQSPEKQATLLRFIEEAVLPALTEAGVAPVGVFTAAAEQPRGTEADHSVYMVAQFNSLNHWRDVHAAVTAAPTFLEAAEKYMDSPPDDPIYARVHVSVMKGFAGFPAIVKPEGGPRIFELRTYESHNDVKAQIKVAMFNEGELGVFEKVGMKGVFFGEGLAGANLPSLTYMLVYKDRDDEQRVWDAFRTSPDWHAMRDDPRWADTVSKIHRVFLLPAECSQL